MRNAKNQYTFPVTVTAAAVDDMETPTIMEHQAALCSLIEDLRSIESITSMHNEYAVDEIIANVLTHLPVPVTIADLYAIDVSQSVRWKPLATTEYSALLYELIRLFNVSWPLHSSRTGTFSNLLTIFGINYTCDFVRVALANLLTKCTPTQFNVSMKIVEQLLRNKCWLLATFVSFSYPSIDDANDDNSLQDDAQQYIQLLVTIPNRIANHSLGKHSSTFEPERFSCIVLFEMLRAINVIIMRSTNINRTSTDTESYSAVFLGHLLGRIVIDFNDTKRSSILPNVFELLALPTCAARFQSVVQPIIWNVPRNSMHLVAWYALHTNKPSTVLGDACSKSADWKFILQTKFPLSPASTNDTFLLRLVSYLAELEATEKIAIFEDVLKAWSSKASTTSQPFDQHFYHTKFLLLALDAFGIVQNRVSNERCQQLIHNGVKHHMATLDHITRAVGMITAEIILNKLTINLGNEIQLAFDFDGFPTNVLEIVKEIRALSEFDLKTSVSNEFTMRQLVSDLANVIAADELEQIATVIPVNTGNKRNDDKPSLEPKPRDKSLDSDDDSECADDDDDDDDDVLSDDLQPYDMTNDVETAEEKMPKYLSDLKEALLNTDNPDIFEQCVKLCASLVQQQLPHDITNIGLDLLSILINLEAKFYMDDFDQHRLAACVAICCIIPKEAAEYLCKQFHAPMGTYSIAVKILVLDVLGESAQMLAKWNDARTSETSIIKSTTVKKLHAINDDHYERALQARRIISVRIDKKTNRFASHSVDIFKNSRPNQFAEVAGYFFFPLLYGCDDNKVLLIKEMDKQCDVEDILLFNFLNTITSVIYAAQNCPIIRRITPEAFQLCAMMRFHVESRIRVASLQVLGAALLATPRELLKTQFIHHVNELQLWLEEILTPNIVKGEKAAACRDMAQHLLAVIYDL